MHTLVLRTLVRDGASNFKSTLLAINRHAGQTIDPLPARQNARLRRRHAPMLLKFWQLVQPSKVVYPNQDSGRGEQHEHHRKRLAAVHGRDGLALPAVQWVYIAGV